MEQSDILTLQAFLMTLSELDSLGDIQAEIQKLSPLVKQNFSHAMEELRKIIYQHNFLETPYQLHHDNLQRFYQAKPRDKCIFPLDESQKQPTMEGKEIENYSLPTQSIEVFVTILESHDSVATTKNVRQSIDKSLPSTPVSEEINTEINAPVQYDVNYVWVLMFC
jgi:hypothetical protein